MDPDPRCDLCGQAATSHVTELDRGQIVAEHRCERHASPAFREALIQLCRSVYDCPAAREAAIWMVSDQLGLERAAVRQSLDDGMRRFRRS